MTDLECQVLSAAYVPWAHPYSIVNRISRMEKGSIKSHVWVFRIGAVFQGSEKAAAAGPQSATAAAVGAAAAAAVATAGAGQLAGAQGLLLLVPLMLGPNGKVTFRRSARNRSLTLL